MGINKLLLLFMKPLLIFLQAYKYFEELYLFTSEIDIHNPSKLIMIAAFES